MTRKPIMLHGNNFDSNRGCQALRLTTQAILDRYLPDYPRVHANIFCNEDCQFHHREPDHGSVGQIWETHHRGGSAYYVWGTSVLCSRLLGHFPRMRVHRSLDDLAVLLLLGGDNLSYDYGFLATLLFFSPLSAALDGRIPTVIWGASIGPFSSRPRWERRFADLLRRVDLITVREPLTQQYLAELGIEDNVRRVVDPAFLLPPCPVELPPDLDAALQRGALGINVAPLMTRYNNQSSRQWFNNALQFLVEVREKVTRPIILIPHVMMSPRTFPDNDDHAFMQSLVRRLPKGARDEVVLFDARSASSKQIKWVISRLRAFVGSRLHATIAALSSCVPTLSIGYGMKSRGIHLDLFGHDDWVSDIRDFDPAALAQQVQYLLQQERTTRRYLEAVMPRYAKRAWKNGALLRNMLEGTFHERRVFARERY